MERNKSINRTTATTNSKFRAAFALVWNELGDTRIGDKEAISLRLESLIAMIGARRPGSTSTEIAKIASRMFGTFNDQKIAAAEGTSSHED